MKNGRIEEVVCFYFDETLNSLSNRIWSIHLFVSCFCGTYVNIFAFFVIIYQINRSTWMAKKISDTWIYPPKRLISIFEPLCEWFFLPIKNCRPLSLDDFQNFMCHFYFKHSRIFHAYFCAIFYCLEGHNLMTNLECVKMLKNQIYFVLFYWNLVKLK